MGNAASRLNLRGFLNFVVTNAAGADPNALRGAGDDCANRLQIDIPTPVGDIVGVADFVPEHRAAATYTTYSCH